MMLIPAHREVMNLVYYQDKSIEEVTKIVAVPTNTVKNANAARSDLVAVLRSDTGRGDKARGSEPPWSWPMFSLGAATPILALAYGSR